MEVRAKLAILADAAKYDASCASSGAKRATPSGGVGNSTGNGICHSYTPDGRCVSLLKILLTNKCTFDCTYCVNRRSSDIPRAAFTEDRPFDAGFSGRRIQAGALENRSSCKECKRADGLGA